jgi:flavin-binding protein dodecin
MNERFKAPLGALAVALATIALLVAQTNGRVTASTNTAEASRAAVAPGTALSELPASDIVLFVDTQRLLTDTLPNFLGADPTLFAKINAKLDKFQQETGIDPRSFDSFAVGVRFSSAQRFHDSRFVSIARGSFVASDLIESGFAAARKKEKIEREEQIYEGKKIYVMGRARLTKADGEKAFVADDRRMAVAELDGNTIVFGDLESVRSTLNPSTARVEQSLVDLATRTPGAFTGFAGNLPPGMAKGLGFGNTKADKLADSIRQVYGSVSTVGTSAETLIAARTETADQARDIAQALNGLKLVSQLGIGRGSSKAEQEAFSSVIRGLTVTSQDNEVEIKLSVTQPEIASLLRRF